MQDYQYVTDSEKIFYAKLSEDHKEVYLSGMDNLLFDMIQNNRITIMAVMKPEYFSDDCPWSHSKLTPKLKRILGY